MINPEYNITSDRIVSENGYTKKFSDIDITLFTIKEDIFGVQNCYMTDGFFDGTPSKECFGRKSKNEHGYGFIYDTKSENKLFFFKTYPMLFTYGHHVFFKPTLGEIMDQLPQSAKDAKKLYICANIDGVHERVTIQKNRHLGIVTIAYPLDKINGEHIESKDGTSKHIDNYKVCYHTRTKHLMPIYCDNSDMINEKYKYCTYSDYDNINIYKHCRNVEEEIAKKLDSYSVKKKMFAVAIETDMYLKNHMNPLDVIPDSLLSNTEANYVFAFPYWHKIEPSNVKNCRCLCATDTNTDLFGGTLWIIHIVTL